MNIPEPFDGFDALLTIDHQSSDIAEPVAENVTVPVDDEFNVYDEVAYDSPFLV